MTDSFIIFSISSSKRYSRKILTIGVSSTYFDTGETDDPKDDMAFFEKDTININPHNDDSMVIIMRCDDLEIKRVLIGQGRSANILYWDAFKRLILDLYVLKPFQGLLMGFLGKPM